MTPSNIGIKNWREFQHYKDRCPPWIKLHHGLLDDEEYHKLPERSAKYLPLLWLLASENKDGILPDFRKIAFRLRISQSFLTTVISDCKHWLYQSASNTLAPCYQLATPETETETERETDLLSDSGVPSSDGVPPLPEIQPLMEEIPKIPEPIPTKPSKAKESLDSRFTEFWNAYPRKIGKGQALKIWQRLKVTSELLGKMLVALETQKQSAQWLRDGGQYIPHPSTWLNQGRWDDEVEPAVTEDALPSDELRRAGILPLRPPKLTAEQRAALGLPPE